MNFLPSLILPPKYDNLETNRLAGYVHYICLAMMVGYAIEIMFNLTQGITTISFLLYATEILTLVTFIINKNNFTHVSTVLIIVINLFAAASLMFYSNGTHDEILLIFPAILFLSCLMFDSKVLLITYLLSLCIVWGIGLMEINGIIVNNFSSSTNLMQLTFISLVLSLSIFVIDVLVEDFKKIIKELKEKSLALEEANSKLHETNLTKDKFISILAHDLRSPFQGILGIANILEYEDSDLSEGERKTFVSKLNTALNKQYHFIEELLLWGKIQQGLVELTPTECNINTLVADCVDILSTNISKKNIDLRIIAPENVTVFSDENLLATLFRNLLSNAIKFTQINGTIEIRIDDHPTNVVVSFIDNGIGISIKKQKLLFQKEFTFSSRGTEDEPGTGLGLILCKEIVDKVGGQILLESEEGKGSKFTVILPKNYLKSSKE